MRCLKLIRLIVLFVGAALTTIAFKYININDITTVKHSFQALSAESISSNRISSDSPNVSASSSTKDVPPTQPGKSQTSRPSNLIVTGDIVKLTLGQRVAFPGDYLVHEQYGVGQYVGIRYSNLTPSRPTPGIYEPVVVIAFSDGEGYWFKRLAAKELYIYRSFSAVAMSATSGGNNGVGGNLADDEVIDSLDNIEITTDSSTTLSDSKTGTKPSKTKTKKTSTTTPATATATTVSQAFNLQESLLSSLCDTKRWKKRFNAVKNQSKATAINLVKLMTIRNNFHRLPCTVPPQEKLTHFQSTFKFHPTSDQINCFEAVYQDLIKSSKPMDRLVCGDVGFGKTEVAMRAMFIVVHSQRQVAVLAPTRVLALQHLRTIQERMPEVNVMLLRGGGKQDAINVKQSLESGECQIVVGTHALLQSGIQFKRLGLLVIDEEQRFGVGHKEKLKVVSSGLDVLTLSATPIPRTLHMSVSGLRDLSLMTAPPLGRKEVQVTVDVWEDSIAVQIVQNELARDGQVFIVVPFVKDCQLMSERLKKLLPDLCIQEAHGQHTDLEDRIDKFRNHESDVLIATTVIENGIDMPNVNTILVYCADRFGMSALYQLRGRVGRSTKQAYAYFFTNTTAITTDAENRLTYLKTFTALGSGYELSMRDMDMRGSGSLFGEQQSGSSDIGIDLQAKILAQSLEKLKSDVVLPVVDTRISLNMNIEILRNTKKPELMTQNAWLLFNTHHNHQNMQQQQQQQQRNGDYLKNNNNRKSDEDGIQEIIENNLNEVSIWEDKMIEVVLSRIFPPPPVSSLPVSSQTSTLSSPYFPTPQTSKHQTPATLTTGEDNHDNAQGTFAKAVKTSTKGTTVTTVKTKKSKKDMAISTASSSTSNSSSSTRSSSSSSGSSSSSSVLDIVTDSSGSSNNDNFQTSSSLITTTTEPQDSMTASSSSSSSSILKSILTAASVDDFALIEKKCLSKLNDAFVISTTTTTTTTSSTTTSTNSNHDGNNMDIVEIKQSKQASSTSFLPVVLSELLRRSEIRMLSRRLGITDIFLTTSTTLKQSSSSSSYSSSSSSSSSSSVLSSPNKSTIVHTLLPSLSSITPTHTPSPATSDTAEVTVVCVAPGVNERKWNLLKKGIYEDMEDQVIFSSHLIITAAPPTATATATESSSMSAITPVMTAEHTVNHFTLTINLSPPPAPSVSAHSSSSSSSSEMIWREVKRLLQSLTIELTALYDQVTADCLYEKPPE